MLPYVIERIGEDLINYESDYPHEPDLAEAIRKFEDRKDLSDSAKKKFYRTMVSVSIRWKSSLSNDLVH